MAEPIVVSQPPINNPTVTNDDEQTSRGTNDLKLSKLFLKNIFRFQDTTIDLSTRDREMLCFVGANMKGKSTALTAIYLCGLFINKTWDKTAQAWQPTIITLRELSRITSTLDHLWYNRVTEDTTANIAMEVATKSSTCKYGFSLEYQSETSFRVTPEQYNPKPAWTKCSFILLPYVKTAAGVIEAQVKPSVDKKPLYTVSPYNDLSYIVHFLDKSSTNEIAELNETLKSYFPDFQGLEIKYNSDTPKLIVKKDSVDQEFDVSSLGPGFCQALTVTATVHLAKQNNENGHFIVLLLDEPTDSVNGIVGPKLFADLNKLDFAQVICCSHNLQFIDSAFESLVNFDTDSPSRLEMTVTAKRKLLESVSGFSNSQLALLDIIKIGSFHRILLVEGPTDVVFLKHTLPLKLWEQMEQQVAIIEDKAHTFINKLLTYTSTKEKLVTHKLLKDVKIFAINDRDYHHMGFFDKTNSDILKLQKENDWLKVEQFYWKKNEFENYLLDSEILNQIAGWDCAYAELCKHLTPLAQERLLRDFGSNVSGNHNIVEEYMRISTSDINSFIDAKMVLYGIGDLAFKLDTTVEEDKERVSMDAIRSLMGFVTKKSKMSASMKKTLEEVIVKVCTRLSDQNLWHQDVKDLIRALQTWMN